jgi:hypothetical protein
MARRNRDDSGRWISQYFRAYITELTPSGVVIYDDDKIHFVSDHPSKDRVETELANEITELWGDIHHQNPALLSISESVKLKSSDTSNRLNPPRPPGLLSCDYHEILRVEDKSVSIGDRSIQMLGEPAFSRAAFPRWKVEGGFLYVRMGIDHCVGRDLDLEIHYVANATFPDLDSKFPYRGLPASMHPVVAMGAALRIMNDDDRNFRRVSASYNQQRSKLVRDHASHQSEGSDFEGSHHDFSITY